MATDGWELELGNRLLATGNQRLASSVTSGGWEPTFGSRRLASGIWLLAAGGWCPAASSRLFDDGAGVVLGVVAEGDFGNVYTLTYRQ